MTFPDPTQRRSKNRSVNDFGSSQALRGALSSMGAPAVSNANEQWNSSSALPTAPRMSMKVDPQVIDAVRMDLRSNDLSMLPPVGGAKDEDVAMDIDGDDEDQMREAMEIESRRLAVLKSYRVVGSGRNAAYERLVSLASRIFKAPISYITIIDFAETHILASRGLGAMADNEHERKSSISARTITSTEEHLVIPDLTQNEEFKNHRNVVGLPHLRFYAAAPLVCPEGYKLGTICVLDTVPRPEGLSLGMMQNLREIAGMVMDVMVEERERKNFEYRQPSQLIATTSNDLMTPLGGVVKGLAAIRADQDLLRALSNQQKEIFNTAFACSSVMRRICQKSVEEFNKSRLERARVQEETKEQGEDENLLVIRDLVKNLHIVMDPFPKKVPLVITTDDAVPPIIVTDDLKVFRSIVNYLTNACSKTETGSVHLKISIMNDHDEGEESLEPSQSVVFSVEDTGCGVDVAEYQHLFKPIIRHTEEEDNSCTLAVLGGKENIEITKRTSLGLYSVATQISSIGGKYGFRPREFSESGTRVSDFTGVELKGSVFWFSVPLIVPYEDKESTGKPEIAILGPQTVGGNESDLTDEQTIEDISQSNTSNSQKRGFGALEESMPKTREKRALIIEDSMTTRRVLSRMLKKLGFTVVESVNGMEGLRELQATLFDIVLCDFLMPVMDGTDCVQQYRQFEVSHRPWFDQYIVGISAHASDADIERGMKVGMNDYRAKPITMTHLEEILEGQEYEYVTTRLDSIAIHLEEESSTDESSKRQKAKLEEKERPRDKDGPVKVCLIIEDGKAISEVSETVAANNGWKSVAVHDGNAALRLLQMRNWDAVLIDENLSGISSSKVVDNFREWESKHRVNRQKNVFQVNSSLIPSGLDSSMSVGSSMSNSSVQLPSGFDGVLGKPLSAKICKQFLKKSAEECATYQIL